MGLRITDKSGATVYHEWADCIISIDDPGSDIRVIGPHHALFVLDEGAPKESDMRICRAILAHTATCRLTLESNLLVHCVLGVSRSTAVALGVVAGLGVDPATAWRRVHEARPVAWPSITLVRCFDDLLGLEGNLTEVALRVDQMRRGIDHVVC